MTSLVMVMPYRQLVRKAREEGFSVCSIWDPRLQSAAYLRDVRDVSDAFETTDFRDERELKRVVRAAAARHDARWIYHVGREDSMLPVYEVAEELGCALNPAAAIRLLNDKLAMRDLLRDRDLSPIRYATAPDVRELRGVLERFGLPAIVKPTSLFGSRGVYLLREARDVRAWEALLRDYDYDGPFLVEEQLRGPEFSVETLSCDGEHQVVGITAKHVSAPPLFVETGHVHPAPLPVHARRAIERLTTALLDACGYRFGPAHTEVILTADGPRIVESQARLGGDRIPRLIELSTGLDVERAIFTMLAGTPPSPVTHRRSARIRYLKLEPGIVRSVRGVEEARSLPFVDEVVMPFAPGDLVPATSDSKTRHGHVIVAGRSAVQSDGRALSAMRRVSVQTSAVEIGLVEPAAAAALAEAHPARAERSAEACLSRA
jgi:biotin carboxylase